MASAAQKALRTATTVAQTKRVGRGSHPAAESAIDPEVGSAAIPFSVISFTGLEAENDQMPGERFNWAHETFQSSHAATARPFGLAPLRSTGASQASEHLLVTLQEASCRPRPCQIFPRILLAASTH